MLFLFEAYLDCVDHFFNVSTDCFIRFSAQVPDRMAYKISLEPFFHLETHVTFFSPKNFLIFIYLREELEFRFFLRWAFGVIDRCDVFLLDTQTERTHK